METEQAEAPRLPRKRLIVSGLGALAAVVLGRPKNAAAAAEEPPIGIILGTRNIAH